MAVRIEAPGARGARAGASRTAGQAGRGTIGLRAGVGGIAEFGGLVAGVRLSGIGPWTGVGAAADRRAGKRRDGERAERTHARRRERRSGAARADDFAAGLGRAAERRATRNERLSARGRRVLAYTDA